MLGFAISLASSLSWGVSDFLGGQQSRRLPVLGVLAVSQPIGLILIGILIVLFGAELGRPERVGRRDTFSGITSTPWSAAISSRSEGCAPRKR